MNFKMGESSTVEMLKYVALCHMFDCKQGRIYQDYYMDQFELIQLNNVKMKKRKYQFNNLASILESDDKNLVDLSEYMYGRVECILVPVKMLQFKRKSKEKATNDGKYVKYIHFQISLKDCNKLSLCVLAVPTGSYTQEEFEQRLFLDKIGLCGEISQEKQEDSVNIVSYHNGSLKKYEKDDVYLDFQSDKNGIIITYLETKQTPVDGDGGEKKKKNDDEKYLQHIIDGIDSLWSNKNDEKMFKSQNDWGLRSENLYNLESCLEEMEEKRYITGEDVMVPGFRCKCKNGSSKLSSNTKIPKIAKFKLL